MPIVGKIPHPGESGFLTGRSDFRFGHASYREHVCNFRRIPFSRCERLPSTCSREFRDRGRGRRECCLLDEFHEFSWWREGGHESRFLHFRLRGRPTLDYSLVTSKSRRERPNWNETRENWGGNWGCESIWESNSREDFFRMDVKVVSFNRLFDVLRVRAIRTLFDYECIEQFFEQLRGF